MSDSSAPLGSRHGAARRRRRRSRWRWLSWLAAIRRQLIVGAGIVVAAGLVGLLAGAFQGLGD